MSAKKLLIIKLSAIGDVVMTLPTLHVLRPHFERIDWLVEKAAADILCDHPEINRLIISPRKDFLKLLKQGRLLAAWQIFKKFRKELREQNYDVALDLQGLFKSGVMIFLSKAKRKIGFDKTREGAYLFLNEKMPPYDPARHAARRYLDAAAYLGADYPKPEPAIYYEAPPEAKCQANLLLGTMAQKPFIIFNPGAQWQTKRWPLAHWQELSKKLSKTIVVTGGPEDYEWGEEISKVSNALNLCGQTSLTVLAALLKKAEAVVTADTGPMHLAAAVGGKGLALFGPTSPQRTGPFGGNFKIIQAPLPCLGCLKKSCDDFKCMAAISPEIVLKNLREIL